MATYTDNYQLTKPTYAEQADIGVINSNMNKIDDIMHSSQISLAPAYDQSQTYAEGDVVMYELLMYKCISPTTGVWDGSKWERTTASESGGGGSAELDILGEASGAVASFADGASAELAKCIVDINPVQDLHGYDKPWAGGAGKNKLDLTTINPYKREMGVTITVNSDGTFTFNGTTTDTSQISYKLSLEVAKTFAGMILNGNVANSGINCILELDGSPYTVYGNDNGSGTTISNDIANINKAVNLIYRVQSGVTLNNVVIKPMIRLATETDATFEPYSNICPISGHTDVTVTVASTSGGSGEDYTVSLGTTYYGGNLDVTTGELEVTWGNIASYAGETLTGEWLSSLDEYSALGTPTTGAQVVYELATPQTVQLTPQEVNSLLGQNNISADTGDVDIVYVKASAPIQPNPTGTPTATLKKLGIEGTVFEVPSGGGGSSSGINYSTTEHLIGTAEGENGIIKPLYEKMTYISSLPNATETEYSLGVMNIKNIYYIKCIAETSTIALPLFYNAGNDNNSKIQMYVSDKLSGKIKINTFNDNRSSMSGTVIIRYTKITD